MNQPRIERTYRFADPKSFDVEIHDPECRCWICEPAAAQPIPPALTLRQIGNRVWLGMAIGNAVMFAYDPHGAWLALTTVFSGGR